MNIRAQKKEAPGTLTSLFMWRHSLRNKEGRYNKTKRSFDPQEFPHTHLIPSNKISAFTIAERVRNENTYRKYKVLKAQWFHPRLVASNSFPVYKTNRSLSTLVMVLSICFCSNLLFALILIVLATTNSEG